MWKKSIILTIIFCMIGIYIPIYQSAYAFVSDPGRSEFSGVTMIPIENDESGNITNEEDATKAETSQYAGAPAYYNDYWDIYIRNPQGQVSGPVGDVISIMVPHVTGTAGGGINYVKQSQVNSWATVLNGNPNYMSSQFKNYSIRLYKDGSQAISTNREHIRPFSLSAGAWVESFDNVNKFIVIKTTEKPKGDITYPATITAAQSTSLNVTGNGFAADNAGLSEWRFKINGVLKDGGLDTPSLSKTINHTFPTEGAYTLELTLIDNVQRETIITKTINVGSGGSGGGGSGGGTCSPSDSGPSRGSTLSGQDMTANATGEIKADNRDSKKFDVGRGIPTSESLYANAFAKNYLFKNQSVNMSGEVSYTVTVKKTYNLTWTEEEEGPPDEDGNPTTIQVPKSDTEVVEQEYTVNRQYDYWLIDNLEVYKINRASMSNYALPGGSVTLNPNNYSPPIVTATNDDAHSSHLQYAECQDVVDLGTESIDGGGSRPSVPSENWQSEAEAVVGENQVRNDHVVFNNATIMNNSWTSQSAPTPGSIPSSSMINRDTLYRSGLMIDSSKTNRANTSSAGTIYYDVQTGIKGGSPQQYSISGINTITVHTPVVNYASVSNDSVHNQKTTPNYSRAAVILDRPFTVTIPTSGQHTNYPGYGNRDYAKYVRYKQVWFPFDVYTKDKANYIPARTWIDIPVNQLKTEFFMPVWIDEGNYEVLFRTIAENTPGGFTTQPNANTNLTHHVATQTIPIEVVGRVYDFRITDIGDFNWETVFRTQKGKAEHSGNYYWVGLNDIDGNPRGIDSKFTLPIRLGSHTNSGYKNVSVKTGYHFKFDLKTKGNMFGSNDAVRITPTFYYVNKDGTGRQEVDLYYHSNEKNFIRIGSADDEVRRYVVLNERLRNVPKQQLIDTANYYYTPGSQTQSQFVNNYIKNASQKSYVGRYSWMILPDEVRTFIGPKNLPASVDPKRALAAEQQWYGEYSIPANVYVVEKGFNIAEYGRKNVLNDKSPIFKKNGYIIVNFNFETIRNGNVNAPHLQYINGPLNNQWQMEGYKNTITDPYGNSFPLSDGDVILYHANKSSTDDFESRRTH